MRRTQPIMLGDVVKEFFKNNSHLSRQLAESRAIDLWKEVVGADMARYTTRITITNGRMFVYVSSSIIRHEIFMRRTTITERLNTAVGEKVVTSIIVK